MALTYNFIQPSEFANPYYDVVSDDVFDPKKDAIVTESIGAIRFSHGWKFISDRGLWLSGSTMIEVGEKLAQLNRRKSKWL